MITSAAYHHLAARHEALLQEAAHCIKEATPVEQVWLLGLSADHQHTESLFSAPVVSQPTVNHCWLLVVVPAEEGAVLSNVQDKLEGRLQPLLPVTVVVLTATQYSEWLVEGHPFAVAVQGKGLLLHQREEEGHLLPAPVDGEALAVANNRLLAQTRIKAQEFMAGAELYTVRVQYRLAAFMLHQAAEQALRTALMVHTGLRLNTHSMDRLLRCCGMFCPQLADVLPRRSERDKRLFGLLQKAYIEARYGEEYSIKAEELRLLMERVKGVVTLMEKR